MIIYTDALFIIHCLNPEGKSALEEGELEITCVDLGIKHVGSFETLVDVTNQINALLSSYMRRNGGKAKSVQKNGWRIEDDGSPKSKVKFGFRYAFERAPETRKEAVQALRRQMDRLSICSCEKSFAEAELAKALDERGYTDLSRVVHQPHCILADDNQSKRWVEVAPFARILSNFV